METGNGFLPELMQSMGKAGATAYVRATLTPTENDGWTVRYLEAVVGRCPPGWEVTTWEYGAVLFAAREVNAGALADDIKTGRTLALGDRVGLLPPLQPECFWQQRPSLFRLDARRLPWPSVEWSLHAPEASDAQWHPRSMLVSPSAPTFALFQVAHRAFYTGDFSSFGAHQVPSDFGRVWVVQETAWLHRVRVGSSQVDVVVRGEGASKTRIDIVGAAGAVTKPVGRTGKVRLRTPDGVTSDAWLYLVDGERCLDYRTLGSRLAVQHDLARQGVEFDVPDDPEAEISSLIGQIEGPCLEYKRQLPDPQSVDRVLKTVAAFATGGGGNIVFGVEPDEITIVGLTLDDSVKQRDRLYQLVRDRIAPAPAVEVNVVDYDNKSFIVLSVAPGLEPPYALAGQTPKFYVRRGTHTCPARPDEIRDAILSRQIPPEDPNGYPNQDLVN